jgi:hypothetical protein
MRFQKEHTKMNTMKNALTPLFQISLAFITGLLVSLPLGIFSFALLLAVPASIILFFCQKGRINIALQHGFQASVLVAVLGIGACMGWLSAQLPGNHVSHAIGQTVTLEGVTSEGSVCCWNAKAISWARSLSIFPPRTRPSRTTAASV